MYTRTTTNQYLGQRKCVRDTNSGGLGTRERNRSGRSKEVGTWQGSSTRVRMSRACQRCLRAPLYWCHQALSSACVGAQIMFEAPLGARLCSAHSHQRSLCRNLPTMIPAAFCDLAIPSRSAYFSQERHSTAALREALVLTQGESCLAVMLSFASSK